MIDWSRIYFTFLEKRKVEIAEEFTHNHHIIPRYEGVDNSKQNLVRLRVEDHATAHWIRWKWKSNLQDMIAWLMLSGKTKEGERVRNELALQNYTIEDRRRVMKEKNPMKNPETLKKAYHTRRVQYEGNYHSQEGLVNIRNLNNSGNQHSPESIEKRKQSHRITMEGLGPEGRRQKMGRYGECNGNFGKKRPGKLAGNYGKSKGTYQVTLPDKGVEYYGSLTEMMRAGYDEGVVKRNRNTGKPVKNGKHKGKFIYYEENLEYGG